MLTYYLVVTVIRLFWLVLTQKDWKPSRAKFHVGKRKYSNTKFGESSLLILGWLLHLEFTCDLQPLPPYDAYFASDGD